jgi:nucleoid-associated protein YgaU
VTWNSAAGSERDKNAPALNFGGGQGRTISLELFFDATEPVNGRQLKDVREETNKIMKLTRIDRGAHRPPICELSWGKTLTGSDLPFVCVVNQLTQRFTLFREDGTPLRATLTVGFLECLDPRQDARETDPEFTTRLVKRGDSLSSIAAEVYQDPALWRIIADANNLDDPRHIPVGLRLNIPKMG